MLDTRQRLRWFALHGFLRGLTRVGARRGDLWSRLVADPDVRADPIPLIDELRSRDRLTGGQGLYLTVDYQIAHELLRSDDFGVVPQGTLIPRPLRWLQKRTDAGFWHPLEPPSLLSIEPPEHTRYRGLVRSVFNNRTMAALHDGVDGTANALLDELEDGSRVVDVIEHYCLRLPLMVISDVLGVPAEDRSEILRFGELAAPSLDFGQSWQQYIQVHRAIADFDSWLAVHLQRVRKQPGDDLLSQLSVVGDDGGRLTDRELRAMAGLLLTAGFETTANLLGNGIRMLLENRDQLTILNARPELWPNAVEETLRLDSPVQLTIRIARRDTTVADVSVRQGELVVIYIAGANRDPAVFDDPDRFDVQRPNAGKHLSFSVGKHFCLGAALARQEGEIGLRSFLDRYPDARLAGPGTRRQARVLGGWSSLPVQLRSASTLAPTAGPR